MEEGFNPESLDRDIDQIDGPTVSDLWLRYFDAVARAGSFTAAARAMGVGQSTVSHAIARLEEAVGTELFARFERGVRLTDAGERLWGEVRPSLAAIDAALRDVRRTARSDSLVTVSVSTSFAAWWLLPRLARFKSTHPEIDLRCITSDNDDRVGLDDADLWIPHGANRWAHLEAHHLTDERIAAVAAPDIAEGVDRTDDPAAVLGLDLIHLEERYGSRFDWSRWFEHHGLRPPPVRGAISNDYSVVVQAAIDGQGAALGWSHITDPLVADGRLVVLGGPAVVTDQPFVVLERPGSDRPAVDVFRAWLVDHTP